MEEKRPQTTIRRIGGYLQRVVPITDATGKIVGHALKPFMVELKPRDLWQILVGASVLALPTALTEEVWILGEELSMDRIYLLVFLSLLVIGNFVYFNFYRFHLRGHAIQYIMRVLVSYGLGLAVAAGILTLFGKCPWELDPLLAIKRTVVVAFPASLTGTLADAIK